MPIKDSDILITPPNVTRTRVSSADPAIIEAMKKNATDGQYVTNAKTYKTAAEAGNEAQVYRRALAKALNIEPHKLVGKTWGMDGDTLLTDREKPGTWRFALAVDRNRAKRTRNTNASS